MAEKGYKSCKKEGIIWIPVFPRIIYVYGIKNTNGRREKLIDRLKNNYSVCLQRSGSPNNKKTLDKLITSCML